jgi:hypothetical protein
MRFGLVITMAIAAYAADPQAVWEQVLTAKGGREKLHNVHSLAIYLKPAQVMMGGPSTTWLCVFPDRYFEFQADGPIQRAMVVDGTADRVAIDATGIKRAVRHVGSTERNQLMLNQIAFLLESAWLQPQPAETHRNEITVQAGGRGFQIFLDKANLPERVVSLPMPGEPKRLYDYRLQHYREFQGIMLPARITSITGMREWTWDADYEVNEKYNPKMFERMPDLADGPEPWRKL